MKQDARLGLSWNTIAFPNERAEIAKGPFANPQYILKATFDVF
jgi:hypothetical protein